MTRTDFIYIYISCVCITKKVYPPPLPPLLVRHTPLACIAYVRTSKVKTNIIISYSCIIGLSRNTFIASLRQRYTRHTSVHTYLDLCRLEGSLQQTWRNHRERRGCSDRRQARRLSPSDVRMRGGWSTRAPMDICYSYQHS